MIENNKSKYVPELTSNLRNNYVSIPSIISKASGIRIFGKRLKSFIFTTDVAIIKNTNADAVIAVYPLHLSQQLLKLYYQFQIYLFYVVLVED